MGERLRLYRIKYWAWPDGARLSTHGEFELPARDETDARQACAVRWPDMQIQQISEVRP